MSTIKLTGRTLDILKNFQSINPSIVFRPGQNLTTVSIGRKILASAHIEQTIDGHFGIYELSKFFGAISLFKDPNITIEKHFLLIADDRRSLRYVIADPRDVTAPSDESLTELPSVDVEFKLTDKMMKDALKAAGVLSQPDIVFEGDGEKVSLSTQNISKPTNEIYSENVGEFVGNDKPFKIIIKVENLKLYAGDYTVRICFKMKIVQFIGTDVMYFVAAESNSMVSK